MTKQQTDVLIAKMQKELSWLEKYLVDNYDVDYCEVGSLVHDIFRTIAEVLLKEEPCDPHSNQQ